jgi:hypothetical protein
LGIFKNLPQHASIHPAFRLTLASFTENYLLGLRYRHAGPKIHPPPPACLTITLLRKPSTKRILYTDYLTLALRTCWQCC